MTQPSLLADIQRDKPKPHKRVRETSVTAYEQGRESFNGRKGDVLRWLAAFWNKYNFSPTSAELSEWLLMRSDQDTHTGCLNCLTLYVRRGLSDLQRPSRKIQSAVESQGDAAKKAKKRIAKDGTRTCSITGEEVETWRIIERGTR